MTYDIVFSNCKNITDWRVNVVEKKIKFFLNIAIRISSFNLLNMTNWYNLYWQIMNNSNYTLSLHIMPKNHWLTDKNFTFKQSKFNNSNSD